ncbi:hypothetical protein EG328_008370 [Venturia inaequalis]|uniref:Uncharacterized protein n=1 Tax=Venturia inaequalis TaxID=5025 RepID=A0A8H3YNI5_VENIN|nr:hypothetical protein EG328_008370 [Venturia inaequalis]
MKLVSAVLVVAAAKRLVFGALASEIVDLNYRTAVRLLRPPIASSHHALSPPARALIHYHLAQQVHLAPAGQAAPPGPNWGTPGAPPPPGGPPSAAIPRPAQEHVLTGYIIALAPAPPSAEAQYVGACPGTIKCPGNNVCTPDPKNKSSFLCIQPLEQCAGIQSQQCQGGKTCVADPRIQCKGQACTGLCV